MFGDIFDFDSPLAPLGSAIDSAIANQGQGQQPTPESTIRQGTIPGGDPNPNAPPAAPPQNWFPGQRPITTATSNADIRDRTITMVVTLTRIHHCLTRIYPMTQFRVFRQEVLDTTSASES